MRNKNIILNYFFLSCLIVLFLNDHFFKFQYTSWLTGKLSDVAGIILLPMLLAYLFPKLEQKSVFVAGLFFIFWKSPFSESVIEIYNILSPVSIHRVIDYSDLIVLLLLPIPYYFIRNKHILENCILKKINVTLILVPTIFVLMSTSPPNGYTYSPENGKLVFFRFSFEIKKTEGELLKNFEEQNITVVKDTAQILQSMRYEVSTMVKLDQEAITKGGDILKIDNTQLRTVITERIKNSSAYKIKELKIGDRTVKNLRFSIQPAYDKINAKKFVSIQLHEVQIDEQLDDNKVAQRLKELYKSTIMSRFKNF